eukprot:167079-Rhodomonas_salina.1
MRDHQMPKAPPATLRPCRGGRMGERMGGGRREESEWVIRGLRRLRGEEKEGGRERQWETRKERARKNEREKKRTKETKKLSNKATERKQKHRRKEALA